MLIFSVAVVLQACSDGGTIVNYDEVTKASFDQQGLRWPFSVKSGRVGCTDEGYLWFEHEGNRFGLNGLALSHGYRELDVIWLPDEEIIAASKAAGLKNDPYMARVSVADMIAQASRRC